MSIDTLPKAAQKFLDEPERVLLTSRETAKFLRLKSPQSLHNNRSTGRGGLPWVKLPNGRVYYRLSDLTDWIAGSVRTPHSSRRPGEAA
ncbi:MAG: hypothetical protein Q8P46_08995 [Hyphomicrobiales bacterium]|nr:hypothetical protein [Hyphomicrobiales bacterium]